MGTRPDSIRSRVTGSNSRTARSVRV
ncbi:hypothetical protein CCACVL1_05677 [Corchorus capsularis]|uniref:Uncharacterized protein n=1 Tax=Corchorus capsularis TaxID=210143 RepID=A0A1R3JJC7_COCAP|nr:hypothetical protein CCACVL1_05677 [Corchorus capsularis]